MAVSARDVIKIIDRWYPRGCKTEKDLERSLHKHLEKNLEGVDVIMQYAAGRVKGDIVVDGKILIEIKDGMESTGQLQRLLGQLDIYAAQWKGKLIVVICGDSQRDLIKVLKKKINGMNPETLLFSAESAFLIVRGKAPPRKKEESWFW